MSRALCAWACACSLLACGRSRLGQAQPHALIDASALDFGATPVLFPVQRNLLVLDGGRVPLHVEGLRIDGPGFEVDLAPLEVPEGKTLPIKLLFRPPAKGLFRGTLSLATDDPDLPALTVALSGTGTEPGALVVTPVSLDFGRVGEGEARTREITLRSTGPADLFLGALGFAGGTPDAFGYLGSLRVPATIPPGAQVTLAVRFSPLPATPAGQGALAIDSSDPLHPRLLVPLAGTINRAPLAVARGSAFAQPLRAGLIDAAVGATVQLDASASSDPDQDLPLQFAWTLSARPAGSAAALSSQSGTNPTLRLDAPGPYSVQLVATDSAGLPSFLPARLDLRAAPAERLVVELVWDKTQPDLDLHFLQPAAALQSAGDCYWANPDPAFVPSGGPAENPHHQGDKLVGYGPETVLWKEPAPGVYTLAVAYKADHGAAAPATTAQVRVYAQGVLVADLPHTLARAGEVWTAGTVEWPSGRVRGAPP